MKDNFAFYNHQASIDLPRCLDLKCDKYMNNFIEFGKSQTEVVTEVIFLSFFEIFIFL